MSGEAEEYIAGQVLFVLHLRDGGFTPARFSVSPVALLGPPAAGFLFTLQSCVFQGSPNFGGHLIFEAGSIDAWELFSRAGKLG